MHGDLVEPSCQSVGFISGELFVLCRERNSCFAESKCSCTLGIGTVFDQFCSEQGLSAVLSYLWCLLVNCLGHFDMRFFVSQELVSNPKWEFHYDLQPKFYVHAFDFEDICVSGVQTWHLFQIKFRTDGESPNRPRVAKVRVLRKVLFTQIPSSNDGFAGFNFDRRTEPTGVRY